MTKDINRVIDSAVAHQMAFQDKDGYFWYTLEATEYIGAEAIFLAHFMGTVDHETELGLVRRIISCQRKDGTWALYFNAEPDLSTTIECYWALKLALRNPKLDEGLKTRIEKAMVRPKDFILSKGGITKARVFTKIHMALHGLVPWSACPAMPTALILMPTWAPVNIYEFSSWARACIIPLLVIMQKKPVRPFFGDKGSFDLEELFAEPPSERDWNFKSSSFFISWEKFFIGMDKFLKMAKYIPINPFEERSLKKCEEWIYEHILRTEDIYPALAYGAMALSALGHSNEHPIIKKALTALANFRQAYTGDDVPANAASSSGSGTSTLSHSKISNVHQQCCISPVWDTPWQLTALLEAGLAPNHASLLKSGRWLISKQITETVGDWKVKNPSGEPGGWSFEFENEYFPDVDDTIQVLHVLNRLALPEKEKRPALERGLAWLVSMQNNDGGWAAFDRNNNLGIVNKIPFSDHGACLDDSSPDITARVIGLLKNLELDNEHGETIKKALAYLKASQESSGAWFARWGVNYIYGTWCVLAGLKGVEHDLDISKAVNWLKSIQHEDSGWSESPETYLTLRYSPYPRPDGHPKGVPSQTAWALMGLIAAGERNSPEVRKGIEFLARTQSPDGSWDEKEFTGTGFPNHFYIRYHGYRHFFPLLALATAKGGS